jgi:hypothetical protein
VCTPTGLLRAKFKAGYLKGRAEVRDVGSVCGPMAKMFFIGSNIIGAADWVILYEEWREPEGCIAQPV